MAKTDTETATAAQDAQEARIWEDLQNDPDANPGMTELITAAEDILARKAAIYEELAHARAMCRGFAGLGKASAAQKAYVEFTFPVKQRGARRNGN